MAAGVIKVLSEKDRSYYTHEDVMSLMGVSRSKSYGMIRQMRSDLIKEGLISSSYPSGRIPKKYFDRMCMI